MNNPGCYFHMTAAVPEYMQAGEGAPEYKPAEEAVQD